MKPSYIRINEADMRVMLELAVLLREAGRFDEAETIARGMTEVLPNSDVPPVIAGTIALQRRNFDEAFAILDRAARQFPDSVFARLHRAEAMLFQTRRSEAEAELRSLSESEPDSPFGRAARGLLEAADVISPIASSQA